MISDNRKRLFTGIYAVDARLLMPALYSTDKMHMIVDQSRNYGATLKINYLRTRAGKCKYLFIASGR